MTDKTLTQALKEAYASAPADEVIYHTLEINHESFSEPIYVVRDWDDLNARLENGRMVTFIRYAFDLTKPDVTTDGVPQCTFEIDNVSREITTNIQYATEYSTPITVTYREYLSSDLSGPQNNPPLVMTLAGITADVFKISATASFGNLSNKRFPTEEYTLERFPSLAR